jgi:amino acid adenylation domain-containing protein
MPLHTELVNPAHEQLPIFDTPAPRIIAEQARVRPDAIALACDAERWSYEDLEFSANRLANYLHSRGVGLDTIVALALERSPQFVAAALAIMKCGATYLPLDLGNPTERLRFMLQDSGARFAITREEFADRFENIDRILLDSQRDAINAQSTESPEVTLRPDQLAYVIYTSGSTGEPKGVEVTHRNLSNLISWHARAFDLDECDRATFQSGIGFDAAVWEIWPHLAIGATIYFPDEVTRSSPEALRDWLVTNRITVSFIPTEMAEQLIRLSWPKKTALRFLLTGGDTLHHHPPKGLPFALVNNYGPTECTVVATSGIAHPCERSEDRPTIGTPIDNVDIHILDERMSEVPDGLSGEIYIGGVGVAHGYRNRPELTAEHFLTDRFCETGGKLYRTGDLGKRLPNGEIAFHGRTDEQMKIRGHRVEFGEINSVLSRHPSVRASFVQMREDVPGEKQLVAYVVPASGMRGDEKTLREAIRKQLPDYMEPSAFVWMERLPLTPNGKVDRGSLPAPGTDDPEFTAPRTVTEDRVAEIITEFLKVPCVSVNDDFFRLGAHSLLGAQIVARVRNVFGAELKLLDVFEAPNVAKLSMKIEEALANQLADMSEAEVEAALATK